MVDAVDDVKELIEGFVITYLEKDPKYSEVMDYVVENVDYPEDFSNSDMDNLIGTVYQGVVSELDSFTDKYMREFQ